MYFKINALALLLSFGSMHFAIGQLAQVKPYEEPYRPQLHFSPLQHWMNDPNGMVYFDHTYHLFFQYYPGGNTWGPMHWGHATSDDLVHWKELPVALYPDSIGYIFSGSAVIDSANTSGFGKDGKIPMVAIFTQHDPVGEKAGTITFQNQSLAYSLDNGNTWTKYSGNPVLKNPGIRDFRDPKVMWYPKDKKWIMTLATNNDVSFYSSPDLKKWSKESEFGAGTGAHGGVWECPDLFTLRLNGRDYWILVCSVNPGGPNGGSATQYFIGDFNGHDFTPVDDKTRWLDYGPDEYAGVTWGNTGKRKIFLGWMSNWTYAEKVPTEQWRSAMTVARELAITTVNSELYVSSNPVKELAANQKTSDELSKSLQSGRPVNGIPGQYILSFNIENLDDYTITLYNDAGEKLIFGYDSGNKQYYIDRTNSGKVDFSPDFVKVAYAPRISGLGISVVQLVVDASSIEIFADGGLSAMTSLFFPGKPYNHLQLQKNSTVRINNLKLVPLRPIWNN